MHPCANCAGQKVFCETLRHSFANKFCANCKEGILVPLAQVRAITAEQAAYFINRFSISIPACGVQSGLVRVRAPVRARRHVELC